MSLKVIHETLEEIPKQYQDLYTEKDGKWHLTGISGVRSDDEINRLNEALRKERKDHKEAKDKFGKLGDKDPDEILALLDKIPELEAAAAGKLDEEKINTIVEARIKTKLAPVERERDNLKKEAADLKTETEGLKSEKKQRIIFDEVRKAAVEKKVVDTAVDDVLFLSERMFELNEDGKVVTRDNVGTTPGVDASVWLSDMQAKRPHWWPMSQGGNSRGSGGGGGFANNPWSKEHWNLTEQGKMVNSNRAQADQMAKAAGSKVGATKPA